jgi:hypothetical protein
VGDNGTQTPTLTSGPHARYFTRDGENIQAVYNLRDTAAYQQLGYRETDEHSYLASLPDPLAGARLEAVPD